MKPSLLSRLLLSSAAVALLAAVGCSPFRNAAERQQRNNMLKAIGIAYHVLNDQTMRPPAGPDDLAPFLGDFPDALQYLKSGEVVFVYGAPLKAIEQGDVGSSRTVLAYEKDAPTRGGLVLMADASTSFMTPEEFRGATLARPAPANPKDK
jgi:hypothetical protein